MSEMTSDDFCFRLLDSRDLVFSRQTAEEDILSVSPFPFFEDFLLGAFRGAAEQLATATAGAFTTMPGRRERKDFSPQTSENTRSILLLCFTKFLEALYSFLVDSPIMAFTLFSTSSMNSSALWPSFS
jgi:hypothetical protein